MALSKETIKYVAHLARIDLKPEELERFSGQLSEIVSFIDQLKAVDTSKVSPTSHILPLSNVLRDDRARPSLPVDKVLGNAPQAKDTSFGVPKVIE